MALRAIKRVDDSRAYLEDDTEEPRATFIIRALTSGEQTDILSTFENGKPTTRTFVECFKIGVREIENVVTAKDKPVKTSQHFMMQPNFRDEIIEIGAQVFEKSFLTADEAKNS